MKALKLLVCSISVIVVLFVACDDKKGKLNDSVPFSNEKVIGLDTNITKFTLGYPENLRLDSNSLIFYCIRSFGTSVLVHLQKNATGVRGVFYELLPTYHQSLNDFADDKNQLLFFQGYSFKIDSTIWRNIKRKANLLLLMEDTVSQKLKYVDGSHYALYHNLKARFGDSNQENLYEDFYTFLREAFLEKMFQLRKPNAIQTDKRPTRLPSE